MADECNDFLESFKDGLTQIANAIRGLTDSTNKYKFTEFAKVISEELVSREKAIEALKTKKTVANGWTATEKGMVTVSVSCTVSNHDNSFEGEIGCSITSSRLGTVATKTGGISAWNGGTVTLDKTFEVQVGDTVRYNFWGDDAHSIFVAGSGSIVFSPVPF